VKGSVRLERHSRHGTGRSGGLGGHNGRVSELLCVAESRTVTQRVGEKLVVDLQTQAEGAVGRGALHFEWIGRQYLDGRVERQDLTHFLADFEADGVT
jgi:hypothetical protein